MGKFDERPWGISPSAINLVRLTELGLLEAVGKTRARHYLAGPVLRGVAAEVQSGRQPLADPYPVWLQGWLRAGVDRVR